MTEDQCTNMVAGGLWEYFLWAILTYTVAMVAFQLWHRWRNGYWA